MVAMDKGRNECGRVKYEREEKKRLVPGWGCCEVADTAAAVNT